MATETRGPYGFVRQTRETEAELIEKLSHPPTAEEHEETVTAALRIWNKNKTRHDYCNNVELRVGPTKLRDSIVTEFFYVNTKDALHAHPDGGQQKRVHSEGWITPPFRDSKFSILQLSGNYDYSTYPAQTIDKARISLSVDICSDEKEIPSEFVEELCRWSDDLVKFQFEVYFKYIEDTDAGNPDGGTRRTAESLVAACTRKADKGELKQTQVVVRNGDDPSARFRHIPLTSGCCSKELLGTVSKRSKTLDLATSRAKSIERVVRSWKPVEEDPWFYGLETADGIKTGPDETLMKEFHDKCVEKIDSTRDTAFACAFGYTPIVDRKNIELSAATRRAIQANAGNNLFFVEYNTPSRVLETNIGIYPRTIYWLGRVMPRESSSSTRRTDVLGDDI